MTAKTLLYFENAILDLFEQNRITIEGAKTVLWTLLTAIYEDELIEEPQRRETIIENIERQKEQLLVNILGPRAWTSISSPKPWLSTWLLKWLCFIPGKKHFY
jgi:hypothetical protein